MDVEFKIVFLEVELEVEMRGGGVVVVMVEDVVCVVGEFLI